MRRLFLKLTLLATVLAWSFAPGAVKAADQSVQFRTPSPALTQSMVKFQGDMRRLWQDHVYWTSTYIVSALAGLPDQQTVLDRLLRNQDDIGNAIKPYYGEAAGNKLAQLLREHIVLAGKVVDAAKAGNQADLERFNKEWYRNANDIAIFLSKANPNWSYQVIKDMMDRHLQFVTAAATTRLKKDWPGYVEAVDNGESHMIHFADILSSGIIKQFPGKFR
ncbi:hypothetical protein [Gorillibacterium massiliense]|uniref:hypothetical protein n=1 Tax=Gorillibacterium massiliense TaxID=1280390 RepID=UPI0004B7E8EB|nr:hypothetical protein [Gorillibacterium massiliense]